MAAAAEIQQRLTAVQGRLTALLTGVTEEQFKRRPEATPGDPAPWSIAEVLAHLLSNEQLWDERIELALDRDGASITPTDEGHHEAGASRGRRVPVPVLVHGLLGARRRTERLLERATGVDGAIVPNAAWHPRMQRRLDLVWMFEKIIGHSEEHCPQVEAIREAVGARPRVAQGAPE
jgi:hypothetical protein